MGGRRLVMRIGAALEAIDQTLADIMTMDRRQKLQAYAVVQALVERLRGISRSRVMSTSIINAQLLKIQFSAEALAGLGGGRRSEEAHLADVKTALDVLTGPDCFGYALDEVE
jgi:hypothetical protein